MRHLAVVECHLKELESEIVAAPESASFSLKRVFEGVAPYEQEFVCILLVTPFLQPIPVWGLSSILGVFILLIYGSVFLSGKNTPIPKRVSEYVVPQKVLLMVLRAGQKLVRLVERVPVWKRANFVMKHSLRWNAFAVAFLGFLLSLPLPVPASNAIPAYTILFYILAGLTENFFLFLLAWICFFGNIIFFSALAIMPLLAYKLF